MVLGPEQAPWALFLLAPCFDVWAATRVLLINCNTSMPVSLPLFNLVGCLPYLRICLNRFSFICWGKSHFKNSVCGQLTLADEVDKMRRFLWYKRMDTGKSSWTDPQIHDQCWGPLPVQWPKKLTWTSLKPCGKGENIKKEIWQRKTDNSIGFLDRMHQCALTYWNLPLPAFTHFIC